MTQPLDETVDLLCRWHDGDREALATLVDRDRDWIENRLRRRRGPVLRRDAETIDDVQDLMLNVLQYGPQFVAANRRQFRGLLARMIENQLVDKARRLDRRRPVDGNVQSLGSESRLSLDPALRPVTQPGEAAARAEEVAWLHLGLEFLSGDERGLVRQHQFEGRSFVDIATERGEQPDAVRMRFRRGLLRLAGIVQRLQAGGVDELLAGDEG